jgi:hypothetical protein
MRKEAKQMKGIRNFSKNAICFPVAGILCLLLCVASFAAYEEDSVELRVEKGDKLIHLCRKYLGDQGKWREVAKFNLMKNPDLILPGQRVKIPVGLMSRIPMDGKVTFVYGDAKVQKAEKAEWVTLNLGDQVSQGSRMQTGKASSVEVTFEDKNSIFMKSDAALGITTSEKRGPSYSVNTFYLTIGRVITKLKEATGSDSRINIRTPSAIASVRGTEFRVSTDEKASMRTEVLTGTVRVSAMETMVQVKEGEGTYVQKGAAPISPRKLLLPPKPVDFKPIYKELPLKLTFEEMAGFSSVRGLLTKDREGRNVLDEKVVTQKEPLEFVNLPDGTYYFFSQGIDELGIEGFQSQPYEVKLRANPLPPLIQTKGEEAEFIKKTAQFTWLKVKDAVMYHIQVAQDSRFTVIKEEKLDYKGESYETGALGYGAYYFRISSIAADGYEAGWSETLPFRLIPPPPAPPLDKPTVGKKEIFLKWRNLGEGITYHFQMAKDAEFKEILVDKKLDKPEVTLQKPKEPGVYQVHTSSIDRKNHEGEFSASQSFEVEKRFPYGVLGGIAAAVGLILLLVP